MFNYNEKTLAENSNKWNYSQITKILAEAENRFTEITEPVQGNHYICYLHESFQKAVLYVKEITTLLYNGFPDGAMTLGKELYETMITLCFFEKNKEDEALLERYFDDATVKLVSESIQLLEFLRSGAEDGEMKENIGEMLRRKMCIRDRYHALAGGLYAPEGWKEKELSNRLGSTLSAVSYTHLDVYKRQQQYVQHCCLTNYVDLFIMILYNILLHKSR